MKAGRLHTSCRNVVLPMSFLTGLSFLTACHRQRSQIDVPDPTQAHSVLTWDGQAYQWRLLTGGPSGAIDATSHPFEIELVPAAAAKYLRSPVSYAKAPAPGQLAIFGPAGAGEQAIEASGMTAKLIGIDNGRLVEGIVDVPP